MFKKASGYASGDDALDDRETLENKMKSAQGRKHDTAKVGYVLCLCQLVVSAVVGYTLIIRTLKQHSLCISALVPALLSFILPQLGSQSDPRHPVIKTV